MFGWIALYRAIMEHWIWNTSSQRLKRWLFILFCVTWQEKVVGFGDKEISLKRGQMVTSVRRLMGLWGTNSTTVKSTLDAFEEHGMIELQREPNMTIITVVNYDKYQKTFSEINPDEFPPPLVQGWGQGWVQNKQYNNIINNKDSSLLIAREKNFYEEFKKSDSSIEYAMRETELDKDGVLKWLEKFLDYCIYGNKDHRNFGDFKMHFVSWATPKIKQEDGKREKQGASDSKDKYSARRGTDAGDKTEKDYYTSF